MERKLATVRKVIQLEPIEGKDKIELVHLDGWQVIVQKGLYRVGSLVIYCEIDSFLPVVEEFEFLRAKCFKSTKLLGGGFRIKSMVMGGVLSQGLVLPLNILKDYSLLISLVEGDDLTKVLNIKKYEMQLPSNLYGVARGGFPSFIQNVDQERIQNCFNKLKTDWLKYNWEKTLKLDGSSMTIYCKFNEIVDTLKSTADLYATLQFVQGVCSMNFDLKTEENDGNLFVEVWKQLNFKIFDYCSHNNRSLAFQGELMGPGVKGNREAMIDNCFFCYDIFDIDKQSYLSSEERIHICDTIGIIHIPTLGTIKLDSDVTIKWLLDVSDIQSMNNLIAEGIVYKSIEKPEVSFKVINNKFALQEE